MKESTDDIDNISPKKKIKVHDTNESESVTVIVATTVKLFHTKESVTDNDDIYTLIVGKKSNIRSMDFDNLNENDFNIPDVPELFIEELNTIDKIPLLSMTESKSKIVYRLKEFVHSHKIHLTSMFEDNNCK